MRISATPIVNVNKLIIKSWKHVAYILLIIFLSAEFDVNVARGKPTFASSVYCDGPGPSCRLSQFAVDGSYTTLSNDYFCFTSNDSSGEPNWWALDMGQLVFVDQVIVTNLAYDSCGNTECGESLS